MEIHRITPDVRELASGLKFPEGPIAMADESVILAEMRRRTLSRVTPANTVEVIAELGGGPNGAAAAAFTMRAPTARASRRRSSRSSIPTGSGCRRTSGGSTSPRRRRRAASPSTSI